MKSFGPALTLPASWQQLGPLPEVAYQALLCWTEQLPPIWVPPRNVVSVVVAVVAVESAAPLTSSPDGVDCTQQKNIGLKNDKQSQQIISHYRKRVEYISTWSHAWFSIKAKEQRQHIGFIVLCCCFCCCWCSGQRRRLAQERSQLLCWNHTFLLSYHLSSLSRCPYFKVCGIMMTLLNDYFKWVYTLWLSSYLR